MKMEWRDEDWFQHASRAKLYQGLNGSRVVPAFAVPRQFHRTTLRRSDCPRHQREQGYGHKYAVEGEHAWVSCDLF
jgi:hypothetical protein